MPDREKAPTGLSRRSVLSGSAALPIVGCGTSPARQGVAAQCAVWLAIDATIDALTGRWAALEARARRRPSRRPLSIDPEADEIALEMAEFDRQLDPLFEMRDSGLEALAKRRAVALEDIGGKLAVAERMLAGEGGAIYEIVAEAASVLRTAAWVRPYGNARPSVREDPLTGVFANGLFPKSPFNV
jgi:hypothetical protein